MSAGWCSAGALEWRTAGAGVEPAGGPPAGEVHLWHGLLGSAGTGEDAVLAADERARAEAFAFADLRRAWVWGRATLRRVLAPYLGLDPGEIVFAYGAHGKPEIAGGALEFNLSHSGRRLVVAVARGRALGVDVERVSRCVEPLALAERFFAPAEAARIRALPPAARPRAFTGLWGAKEAYAKALGDGLTIPLNGFEVAGELERPALVRPASGDRRAAADWTLAQTGPAADYVCSLAWPARGLVLVERVIASGPPGDRGA